MSDTEASRKRQIALCGLLHSVISAVLDPMSGVIFAALHQQQSSAVEAQLQDTPSSGNISRIPTVLPWQTEIARKAVYDAISDCRISIRLIKLLQHRLCHTEQCGALIIFRACAICSASQICRKRVGKTEKSIYPSLTISTGRRLSSPFLETEFVLNAAAFEDVRQTPMLNFRRFSEQITCLHFTYLRFFRSLRRASSAI